MEMRFPSATPWGRMGRFVGPDMTRSLELKEARLAVEAARKQAKADEDSARLARETARAAKAKVKQARKMAKLTRRQAKKAKAKTEESLKALELARARLRRLKRARR